VCFAMTCVACFSQIRSRSTCAGQSG
jgi:hypothetical protein